MDGRHAAPTPHGDEVSPGATAARTSVDGRAAWRRLRRMGRARASRSNLLAGLLAALLGFGIATQVRETQSQGLEDLREDELVRILDDVDQNGNRLDSQIRELERSRDELTAARGDDKAVEDAARERLDTLGILSGTVVAVGPGVVITIDETAPPDFAAMRAAITEAVPNATLDDHRAWVGRLVAMARTTTLAGLAVLALVMAALVMTVVFATRGALAGNHEVIEVLHFVGARAGFIARQFERRFLVIGLQGAAAGGAAAVAVFLVTGFWASRNLTSAENEQLSAFFGDFSMGAIAYVGVALVVVLVGALTMVTTRVTVLRVLYEIDEKRADPSL